MRRDEQAVQLVRHHLATTRHVGGDQRSRTGGRLDQRLGQALAVVAGQRHDIHRPEQLAGVVHVPQPFDHALRHPLLQRGFRNRRRIPGIRHAGEQETDIAAGRAQLARGLDILGHALVPQQPRGQQHAGLRAGRAVAARAGGEARAIHARTGDQVDAVGPDQAGLPKHRLVVRVLQDQARAPAAQGQPQHGAHHRPQAARLAVVAGKNVAQAGHRIDACRHARQLGGQRSVYRALDRETVHQRGAFAPEQPHQARQQLEFTHRIEAATIHSRQRLPAQAEAAQALAIFTGRRDQQHLIAAGLRRQRQRAAEVVEVPVGVGEKDDLHGSWRSSPPGAADCAAVPAQLARIAWIAAVYFEKPAVTGAAP